MERGNDWSDKAVRLQSFIVIPDPDGKVFEEIAGVALFFDIGASKGNVIAHFLIGPGGHLSGKQTIEIRPVEFRILFGQDPVQFLRRKIAALRQAVRDEMPEFTEKLSAFEYKPNLVETQIIILTRLRFLLSEITVLLGISSSSLSMKRRRLLKRLFGIDGSAGTFDDMIRQL